MGISPLVQPLRRRQNMKRTLLTWLVLVIGLSLSSALPHPGVEQSGAEEMHPLSKMEPLYCPIRSVAFGLPKLMNWEKEIIALHTITTALVLVRLSIVVRVNGINTMGLIQYRKDVLGKEVYCDMDKEEISEWNKPCQTDYLKFDFNANETRHHFCIYGNVFDPNTSHPFIPCVSL